MCHCSCDEDRNPSTMQSNSIWVNGNYAQQGVEKYICVNNEVRKTTTDIGNLEAIRMPELVTVMRQLILAREELLPFDVGTTVMDVYRNLISLQADIIIARNEKAKDKCSCNTES